eukprot:gene16373-biopygen8004
MALAAKMALAAQSGGTWGQGGAEWRQSWRHQWRWRHSLAAEPDSVAAKESRRN